MSENDDDTGITYTCNKCNNTRIKKETTHIPVLDVKLTCLDCGYRWWDIDDGL